MSSLGYLVLQDVSEQFGGPSQEVRFQDLCSKCEVSGVCGVTSQLFGDLSQDGRAPSSLGIDYQGVKTLNNLGNSKPGCEVFEMFVHFYPTRKFYDVFGVQIQA